MQSGKSSHLGPACERQPRPFCKVRRKDGHPGAFEFIETWPPAHMASSSCPRLCPHVKSSVASHTRAPLTSIQNTPNLLADAFCQTNFVGDDGDCPSRVCVRLLGHDDARTGDAVLRYHALLLARPWTQPGLLPDDAIHARTLSTAGLREWVIVLIRFRRRSAGI